MTKTKEMYRQEAIILLEAYVIVQENLVQMERHNMLWNLNDVGES